MLSKTPKVGSIKSSCRTSRTILSSDLFEVAFCATAVHAIIENKLTTATSSLNFILILLALPPFGRSGCNLSSYSWEWRPIAHGRIAVRVRHYSDVGMRSARQMQGQFQFATV